MDNLNTHSISSLYEASPRCGQAVAKIEIHHPQAWKLADMAEIELSALTTNASPRRIDNIEDLKPKF